MFASTVYGRVCSLRIQDCIRSAGEPFPEVGKRELLAPGNSLQVDLGYEIYAGLAIEYLKLMASRIRFAAPPKDMDQLTNLMRQKSGEFHRQRQLVHHTRNRKWWIFQPLSTDESRLLIASLQYICSILTGPE